MTPERYERLRNLFIEAQDLAPSAREDWIVKACDGDRALQSELTALLRDDQRERAFLETPAVGRPLITINPNFGSAAVACAQALSGAPELVGYRLLGVLGQGGMGVVYEAKQIEPVERDVAIKVIRAALDSPEARARFMMERQALARMNHPFIATVYDAGTAADGRPYVVMERVEGKPIASYCEAHELGLRARLQLFLEVCQAVQHAHHKGVIHRDIKPSNILVAAHDGVPMPKIIDFGLARSLHPRVGDDTITAFGNFAGTPEYMSPEQAEGGIDLDVRSDVYALGVLLYELLTSSTPFTRQQLRGLPLPDLCRVIREEIPPKPSDRVRNRVANAPVAVRIAPHELRGDLDWITMRCLEKDPQRRYESVAALADDVRRSLRNEPVLAGPPSVGYRLAKFARRRRGLLAILMVGGCGAAVSVAALLWGFFAARAAQREAEAALARSRVATNFLVTMIEGITPEVARGRDTALLAELLNAAADDAGRELADQPSVYASMRRTMGKALLSLSRFREAEPHLEAALAFFERQNGDNSADVIDLRTQLAVQRMQAGRTDEGRKMLGETLARATTALGPDHRLTATALLRHSQSRRQLDENPLDDLQLRLPSIERALGANDDIVIALHAEVAELVLARGDFASAIAAYERVVAALRGTRGDDAPQTIRAISNLARAYELAGQLERSLELAQESAEKSTRVLGPRHADTLVARSNLGHLLSRLERLEAAAIELEEVLAAREAILGPTHQSTLTSANNLAVVYRKAGRFSDAEPLLRRCLDGSQAQRGPRHMTTLIFQVNYADLLAMLDEASVAEPLVADAIVGFRELGDAGRVSLGSALLTHGAILTKLQRFEQAEEVLLESDRLLADLYPESDPRRHVVFAQLLSLYETWGHHDEAARWRARAEQTPEQ